MLRLALVLKGCNFITPLALNQQFRIALFLHFITHYAMLKQPWSVFGGPKIALCKHLVHFVYSSAICLHSRPGVFGLIHGVANPTGIALIIILTIMVICSMDFVRRSGYFQVFYFTHLLYYCYIILLILHAPHFWRWCIVFAFIFLLEKLYRQLKTTMGVGHSYISDAKTLASRLVWMDLGITYPKIKFWKFHGKLNRVVLHFLPSVRSSTLKYHQICAKISQKMKKHLVWLFLKPFFGWFRVLAALFKINTYM